MPWWPDPGGSLAIVARPWAGSASHPHRSQPIANQHHAGVHCSFSDQRLVVCLGLVNGKEMMSLFDYVMCLLPAAALEAVRGKGFRHQKLVANAFLTVSAFADFLQCAVSDVSDFHNRCVGAAASEVFLATVRLQQPTLFETSAAPLSPSSSTVASCTSGVAPAPGPSLPRDGALGSEVSSSWSFTCGVVRNRGGPGLRCLSLV